jgi:AAA+ ATPase superfamily predicted ATPase
MFIGRKNELGKLDRYYESSRFEMLIVYGRRRVGKTKLLTEFIKGKNAIYYVAEENNDFRNKDKFAKIVMNHFKDELNVKFEEWEDIFKYIAKNIGDDKLVLVIDELPYIALSNLNFLSMLQNVIDHELLNKNIMLILCGSSISFMENEIVAHKSPLYGRKTGQLKIEPFDYYDVAKFFPGYTNENIIKIYGVLGGIPHYLIKFDEKYPLEENIIKYILDASSFLYDEPNNLLHQELRNPAVYNAIIEAIAGGSSKINEIATKINETSTKTSKYIKSLLELRILKRVAPINKEDSKKSIYLINDNLYKFIYRYVYSNRSMIEQDLGELVYHRKIKPDWSSYLGKVFEDVCLEYMLRKNRNLELEFVVEKFGTWWGNNPLKMRQEEIDLVGLSKNEGVYCECKYRNEKIGVAVYDKLIERSNLIPKGKMYYYIFSKSGFTTELQQIAAIKKNVKLITLGELFKVED